VKEEKTVTNISLQLLFTN